MAAGAAALATLVESTSGAVQRALEREQVFRGREIAAAISRYRAAFPNDLAGMPRGFDELIEDRRGPTLHRHLRRAYSDPFTGRPDWEPVVDPDGGWQGVRSRSDRTARLRLVDDPPDVPGRRMRLSDRVFIAARPVAPAPIGASTGTGAGEAGAEGAPKE